MPNDTSSRVLTIAELNKLGVYLKLHKVFLAAGLDPSTMRSRLRRGSPELTVAESDAIRRVIGGVKPSTG